MVFYQVRALTDNFAATNNFIGSLLDNGSDESLVDQRLRFTVSSTLNKYANFTYTGEIDMQFGDESYSNSGRNDGGAIGGDTTNLESKTFMSISTFQILQPPFVPDCKDWTTIIIIPFSLPTWLV